MKNRQRFLTLIGLPSIYLFLLFILPMGLMFIFSFRAGTTGAARGIFTFDNYIKFIHNASFQRLLWRSAGISFFMAVISCVLAYPLAYYLAFQAGSKKTLLMLLVIIPTWTSYLLRIFSWKLILGSTGLLNSILLALGLIDQPSPILIYSRTAVVVTLIYVWVPFVMLPIFASLERIDRYLLEAAADLGCTRFEAFLRVTFPLSLPGVVAGFFFAFIPTLGEFVTPLLVGGAQGSMYGNLIQDQFMRALNWPMGSVMSLAMLAIVLLLMFLLTRLGPLTDLLGL
jgi:spermidine/putrescine transport system permease protein